MKFRAEVEIELPEDLHKYCEVDPETHLSFVNGLTRIKIKEDLYEAMRLFGMAGQVTVVSKVQQ